MVHMSAEEVTSLVRAHIESLKSARIRCELLEGLISPIRQRRTFQTAHGDAEGDLWLFFIVPNRDVGLAYSEDGYGALGLPWGLVHVLGSDYGGSGAWYSSLNDLVNESG